MIRERFDPINANAAVRLLAQEATIREGSPPPTLASATIETPMVAISNDAFLLKLPSGLAFRYQRGKGVTVSRPPDISDAEVDLYLNGSVYGAIAWLNGFVPLHASGIVHNGAVHAFTGASGAGKSTMAGALSGRGFPLIVDDVMVLDLSDPKAIWCLPGHKKLKLWRDALALTGCVPGQALHARVDKFLADPPGGMYGAPAPLSHLCFLTSTDQSRAEYSPIVGAEGFALMRQAFYRPYFYAAIGESQRLFGVMARLCQSVKLVRFDRPLKTEVFAAGVDAIANSIRGVHA